jgi:hypothetical protein
MTESPSDYFRAQAEWRESKSEEYPDDERNAQSAAALHALAEFVDANPELSTALSAHQVAFTIGGEEAQRAISRYGFGYQVGPGQHAEFLEELLALCLQDAYTFAGDAGDGYDYSGQLFAFEIAAARDGVFLPASYWRKRSGSLEHELEQAVESFRVPDREEA